MANRLKTWLPILFLGEQSAFVSMRHIQDDIFFIQEVVHQLRVREHKEKFQAVLKLNMQKAYDRVEWDFLEACMLKMGFHERWVSQIIQYVT